LSQDEILKNLREKGAEDAGTMTGLTSWLDSQQTRAEEDPTNRMYILVECARADFYIAIGDTDGAYDCLDAAAFKAQQEGHFDLLDSVEAKISALTKMIEALLKE
jgi:hypothetical protein